VSQHLTAEEILDADDLPWRDEPTPEWGAGSCVRIRTLTGDERDQWEVGMANRKGKNGQIVNGRGIRAELVAASAISENGAKLFTPQQVAKLGSKSAAVVNRLYGVALELSGIGEDEEEDIAKNYGGEANDDSGSTLPELSPTPA